MQRDRSAIIDIVEAAVSAMSFVEGMDLTAFMADRRTQKAVIYDIQTIGEAAKRLSMEFREIHSSVPWSLMAGMRDKLVHDYDRVDLNRVWLVVREDLPELTPKLQACLDQFEGN